MAAGSGGSWQSDELPNVRNPLYKCSFCPKTFTNLQARGGHMTKHRHEVTECRRKHEEYMAKKSNEFSVDLLPPNKAYWRRYHNGKEKPKEPILFPVDKTTDLDYADGESSHHPVASGSIVTDLEIMSAMDDKEKGGENPIIDLTMKL